MFVDGLREAVQKSGLIVKEIAARARISKRTIDSYLESSPRTPVAEKAVDLAVALNTTVEELVLGETGRAYVIEWAGRHGARWRPPPHLEELCEDLKRLPHESVEVVHAAVKKLLEVQDRTRNSEPNPQAKVS